MIVVADAGPIHYLVLISAVDVLQPLCHRVLVPQTVAGELRDAKTPDAVRNWIAQPPKWCEVRPDPPSDPSLFSIDPGEAAAIALAVATGADRLLIDDHRGRAEAERRALVVIGTLGILAEAHRQQLIEFEEALERLRKSNFYFSEELINRVRQRL